MRRFYKVGLFFAIFLLGCSIELRSPIVIKRTPNEEEKTTPRKVVPPPPLATPKEVEKPKKETAVKEEPIPEQPKVTKEVTKEVTEEKPKAEPEIVTGDKTSVSSAKNIVILSQKYLENTEYKTLERITVKDVSQNGFTKKEAKEALQFEAFRRFGSQAKGITNIEYKGKTSIIPGSERFSEVSGDVVTWERKSPISPKETEISPPSD